ncbi:hypothetical protein Tco_0134322 [Tanacetum coccineum]
MANESYDHSNLPSLLGAFTGTLGSSSSSSSFLAMSLESELDSSELDNEDNEFIDELTRQMADYMLQEDANDNNNDKNLPPEGLVPQIRISEVNNPNKNQHGRVGKSSKQRRRGKKTEFQHPIISYRPLPSSGSGMRAIFLNRSGSNNESNGTGVFLPRSADDPTTQSRNKLGNQERILVLGESKAPFPFKEAMNITIKIQRERSGSDASAKRNNKEDEDDRRKEEAAFNICSSCSTALVPTRVLEALEQHFNNLESLSPSNNLHRIQPTNLGQRNGLRQKFQPRSASTDQVEKKLPKEWSY